MEEGGVGLYLGGKDGGAGYEGEGGGAGLCIYGRRLCRPGNQLTAGLIPLHKIHFQNKPIFRSFHIKQVILNRLSFVDKT